MANSRLERIGTILSRNNVNENFFKSLMDIITQLEADYDVLRENEQKLEHLANVFVKCIKQTSSAQKQNLKALKDIHGVFMKEVEGLLTRGGMKPEDRPIWYDVYKAFPPMVEPKFSRPKPEIKPIMQILYKEDVLRAKFHSQGLGLGAVNMLNPIGDTQTKKLVQQYQKLQAEGVPESEIIEKAVSAVGLERQQEVNTAKLSPNSTKSPNSAATQVLADADLKNIFKEEK